MKKFSPEEISSSSVEELICRVRNDNYSIVDSFCHERISARKHALVNTFRIAFNFIWSANRGNSDFSFQNRKAISKKIARFLMHAMPSCFVGVVPSFADCLVAEYNARGDGEIVRLVAYALDNYATGASLFAIDLVDYELLVPLLDKFEVLGIQFCPIMTDNTYSLLSNISYDTPNLAYLRDSLYDHFIGYCSTFASEWCNIWIPFDMTVHNTLFESEDEFKGIAPIRTSIASDVVRSLLRHKQLEPHMIIMAVSILPESEKDDGLGFHREYLISFGETYNAEMAKTLLSGEERHRHDLDYAILKSIANALIIQDVGYSIIY